MIFKRKSSDVEPPEDVDVDVADGVDSTDVESGIDELDAAEASSEVDWRADGPFDSEEVDLDNDAVVRVDLGSLIVTPMPNVSLALQVDQAQKVLAVILEWAPEVKGGAEPQVSQFEVVLYAAPASGRLAEELMEDIAEEARDADGTADIEQGVFGSEVRRVIPIAGPGRQQAYHTSRIWFVEGPRWALRGTLMGAAAEPDADPSLARPFEEFFRNLIVRRGEEAIAPGTVIGLTLPEMG